MADRSHVAKILNAFGIRINPSTEEKQDDIIARLSSVQSPVPTNGDSVYCKDINSSISSIGSFSPDDICNLVDDYETEIIDSSVTNPKNFTIRFNRPILAANIGIGSGTGNFSNVKIYLKDLSGVVRTTMDDSSNNTKYTSNLYPFTPQAFIELTIEFHTVDEVRLNGLLIEKITSTTALLRALKPDGTITNIDATAGGNLKVSVEEMDITAQPAAEILVDDFTTPNKTYVGKAVVGSLESGAVWQISCLDETGNFLKVKFADDVSSFTKVWDDRVSYGYA